MSFRSGLSATHEEYREARGRKPVLAFVQDGAAPDAVQEDFIREVQAWDDWLFRAGADLRDALIGALHDFELAHAGGRLTPMRSCGAPASSCAIRIATEVMDILTGHAPGSESAAAVVTVSSISAVALIA